MVGTAAAADLVVTYLMTIAGCIVATRTLLPIAVTVTLTANLRAIPIAVSFIQGWGSGKIRGTDEAYVAAQILP